MENDVNVLSLGLLINEDDRNYLNKYFEFVRKMQNYFISYELKKFNKMRKAYDCKYDKLKIAIENKVKEYSKIQKEISLLKTSKEDKKISKADKKKICLQIKNKEDELKEVKECQKKLKKDFFDLLKEFEMSKFSFISDVAIFDKTDYFTKPIYKTKNGKVVIDKNGNKVPILDEDGNIKRKCFVSSKVRAYSIALPIWSAFEKKINEDSIVHFKNYRDKSSINSIAFPASSTKFTNNSFYIPSVKKHIKFRIPKTDYEKEIYNQEKMTVIRIKRFWDNTKYQYSVQFTFNSSPAIKKDYNGNIKYPLGKGTAELIVGINYISLHKNDYTEKYTLVPPDSLNIDKEIRKINRAMDRSKRSTNPNNYDVNGKPKKFYEKIDTNNPDKTIKLRLRWKYSNHYNKLSQRKAYLEGVNARKRKLYDEQLANELLKYFDTVNIKKPNIKSLQMSKKKYSVNDNEKTAEDKSVGYYIKNGAPAQFIDILTRKVESRGGIVNVSEILQK